LGEYFDIEDKNHSFYDPSDIIINGFTCGSVFSSQPSGSEDELADILLSINQQ
jgi:hypothetical protein